MSSRNARLIRVAGRKFRKLFSPCLMLVLTDTEDVALTGEALVFEVLWDDEAKVWYTSETPIQGALAEAPTLDELSEKLSVIIPEVLETKSELP